MRFFITLAIFVFLSSAAQAKIARAEMSAMTAPTAGGQNCKMITDAQVSVNFNITETDISKVQGSMDARIAEAQALAKDVGIETAEMQSSSYSLYNNNSGNCDNVQYQINGSMSFKIAPAEKSQDFLVALAKKGYGVSFNVNSYRQCDQ